MTRTPANRTKPEIPRGCTSEPDQDIDVEAVARNRGRWRLSGRAQGSSEPATAKVGLFFASCASRRAFSGCSSFPTTFAWNSPTGCRCETGLLWFNTLLLILAASPFSLRANAARPNDAKKVKVGVIAGGMTSIAFIAGQLFAWRQLIDRAFFDAEPGEFEFFYLITALHGLHVLGWPVGLG